MRLTIDQLKKIVKEEVEKEAAPTSSEQTAFVVGYFGYGDSDCYLHSIHTSEESANKAWRELKKQGKAEGYDAQGFFMREVPLNPGAINLHDMEGI